MIKIFNDRRSIRKYNKDFKIEKKELEQIFTESFRAPSSMNLQPTKVLVITSLEEKEKLRNALYGNHLQLDTSSAIIVVLTDLDKYKNAEFVFGEANKSGLLPDDVLKRQVDTANYLSGILSSDKIKLDGYLDAGLFSMQLMLVAKKYGYDTCPIGGFNSKKLIEIFNLSENLEPVLIISLGKASEEGHESHRLNLEHLVTYK